MAWLAAFTATSAAFAVAIFLLAASLSRSVPTPDPSAAPTAAQATDTASAEPMPEAPGPGGDAQDRDSSGELGAPGALPGSGVDSADGILPNGATVFDEQYPGVGKLDPALLNALQQAARDSRLSFYVSSGWRSERYQAQLLEQAISTYGSEAEAAKWVAPPDKSLHVWGDAVDLDGPKTKKWLAEHGAAYGLCLAYANEPWHFELRTDAPDQGCPKPYPDPAHDPRLR
ncbi:MAG: D-alanyl-D-alanine carboxypeptidase family protein [Propionibacteriaceae bacterium]|nr:D-alanyl-D-alanine carboxypeptidase family protein [Propionibacteriaceae bacterium]